mgnify:CR=1 FL=1
MELKMKELSASKPAQSKTTSTTPLGDQVKGSDQTEPSEPVQIVDRTEMLRKLTEQASSK